MSRIVELEQNIRDIFNIPRRHKKTRSDKAAFFQACSAMDAIGDTELALQEYISCDTTFSDGLNYIFVYGVLQAIFLQQDAIRHLAESLELEFNLPQELRVIRELRNEAIGHPTKKTQKKGIKSFHQISRVSLSKNEFQLVSSYSDKEEYDIKDINLNEIIKTQSNFSERLLSEILDRLREDENSHRKKYMNDKLTNIFHSSLSYLLEKVGEGIRREEHRRFGLTTFESIVDMLNLFENKLRQRDEEEIIEDVKNDLAYPIEKVLRFLKEENGIDQRDAEIHFYFIKMS